MTLNDTKGALGFKIDIQENQDYENSQEQCILTEIGNNGLKALKSVFGKYKGKLLKERKQSENQSYICSICGKVFPWKYDLKQHEGFHQKSFKCDICGKLFSRLRTLTSHIELHVNEKSCVCSICGRAFSRPSHLQRHMNSHTGGKPFKCDLCNKGYSCKSVFDRHMKIIHGPKDERKKYLSRSKTYHHRSEPCQVCGKTFCDALRLKQHMQIHTGLKEVECSICKQDFFHIHSLNRHMMRKHNQKGNKGTQCMLCKKVFATYPDIEKHINEEHDEL